VTVSEHFAPTPDEPCVADWDSTSYTSTPHCLRRVDGNKHYPRASSARSTRRRDLVARALWDIHRRWAPAGRHDHHPRAVRFTPDISMPTAAATTIATRPVRDERPACGAGRLRGARARVARARALQRQGRPLAEGEDQRDHGRQRYHLPASGPTAPAADGGMSGRMLDFLAYLEFERGLSRNTLEAYRSTCCSWGLPRPRGVDVATSSTPTSAPSWPSLADRRARSPAGGGRDAAAQGGVPALLLSPPASRGRPRPRPTADLRAPRKSQRLPQVSAATRSPAC
jgi:hypothetical protein